LAPGPDSITPQSWFLDSGLSVFPRAPELESASFIDRISIAGSDQVLHAACLFAVSSCAAVFAAAAVPAGSRAPGATGLRPYIGARAAPRRRNLRVSVFDNGLIVRASTSRPARASSAAPNEGTALDPSTSPCTDVDAVLLPDARHPADG